MNATTTQTAGARFASVRSYYFNTEVMEYWHSLRFYPTWFELRAIWKRASEQAELYLQEHENSY